KTSIYTRYGNPTLSVAEGKIAALEGGEAAVGTASGMAAISAALLGVLKCGDELISTAQVYGGSYRLMRDVFPDMGIKVLQVGTDFADWRSSLRRARGASTWRRRPIPRYGLSIYIRRLPLPKNTNLFRSSTILSPRPCCKIRCRWVTTSWCTVPRKRWRGILT